MPKNATLEDEGHGEKQGKEEPSSFNDSSCCVREHRRAEGFSHPGG